MSESSEFNVVGLGTRVLANIVGTTGDGTEFENTHKNGEPMSFIAGEDTMLSSFTNAILGMNVGEKKEVTLPKEECFGEVNPERVLFFPRSSFPEEQDLVPGARVTGVLKSETGEDESHRGFITAVAHNGAIVDLNHPLAGQSLKFEIEILQVN